MEIQCKSVADDTVLAAENEKGFTKMSISLQHCLQEAKAESKHNSKSGYGF